MLGFALVIVASSATAQEASVRDTSVARGLFEEGVGHVEAERWAEAREAFTRSLALSDRPMTRFNLGIVEEHLGHLVAASEHLRVFLREASGRRYAAYVRLARERLDALVPRIGSLVVSVSELRDGDRVELDGEPLSEASLDVSVPIDPGDHRVVVLRDARTIASETFAIADGQQDHRVTLTLRVEEVPRAALSRRDDPPPADDDGTVFESPWFWLVSVLVVAGGVTAGVFLLRPEADPVQGSLGIVPVR